MDKILTGVEARWNTTPAMKSNENLQLSSILTSYDFWVVHDCLDRGRYVAGPAGNLLGGRRRQFPLEARFNGCCVCFCACLSLN